MIRENGNSNIFPNTILYQNYGLIIIFILEIIVKNIIRIDCKSDIHPERVRWGQFVEGFKR